MSRTTLAIFPKGVTSSNVSLICIRASRSYICAYLYTSSASVSPNIKCVPLTHIILFKFVEWWQSFGQQRVLEPHIFSVVPWVLENLKDNFSRIQDQDIAFHIRWRIQVFGYGGDTAAWARELGLNLVKMLGSGLRIWVVSGIDRVCYNSYLNQSV